MAKEESHVVYIGSMTYKEERDSFLRNSLLPFLSSWQIRTTTVFSTSTPPRLLSQMQGVGLVPCPFRPRPRRQARLAPLQRSHRPLQAQSVDFLSHRHRPPPFYLISSPSHPQRTHRLVIPSHSANSEPLLCLKVLIYIRLI